MSRLLGYVACAVALAAFGHDVWRGPMQDLPLAFTSTATYWSDFHLPSLDGLRVFVETNLTPELWSLALLPMLSWPAFVLAIVVALIFFAFGRPKRRVRGRDGMMFPRNRR